jgi:glycosyltransferase involved in cell wall biosynthesis
MLRMQRQWKSIRRALLRTKNNYSRSATRDVKRTGDLRSAEVAKDRCASSEGPLISIILLCYNQENYVAEAVAGVLNQTYSPLEVLIFDDFSSDHTEEVIRSCLMESETPHKVRFIRNHENLGAEGTLKFAFDIAKGRFIVISCGDDIMLPEMVEKMAGVWINEDVSLVTANASFIDEHSKLLNRTFRDPNRPADDTFDTLARDGSNACCFGPAIGFERDLYETFGWIPADKGTEGYDIIIPFYAYLLKGARFVNEPLLKYRVHGQNTSLSLVLDRSSEIQKLEVEERIYLNHLSHAVLMDEVIQRLCSEAPARYGPIATRILPLLTIQIVEMSKKLVRVHRALQKSSGCC